MVNGNLYTMKETNTNTWISVSIFYDNLDKLIVEAVLPFSNNLSSKAIVKRHFFDRRRERGEHLMLALELENLQNLKIVKEEIEKIFSPFLNQNPGKVKEFQLPILDWFIPYPNGHVRLNNNFSLDVMETGGVQATKVYENILSISSQLVLDLVQDEGWNSDSAIAIGFQVHLAFLNSFKTDLGEIKIIYDQLMTDTLQVSIGDNQNTKDELLAGLEENFLAQKDGLVEYISYVLESTKNQEEELDEWLLGFMKNLNEEFKLLTAIQINQDFEPIENFKMNMAFPCSIERQRLWPFIAQCLKTINRQLGIVDVFEFNQIYFLKRSVHELINENEEKLTEA